MTRAMNNKTASAAKVFFVISHSQPKSGAKYYIDPQNYGTTTLEKARKFATAGEALDFCIKNTQWLSLQCFPGRQIIKVTETATGKWTKLVSKTEINPMRPVVLYNVTRQQYGVVRPDGSISGVSNISEATVHTDLADAMIAHARSVQAAALYYGGGKLDIIHVHQVEIVAGETKLVSEVVG